MNEMAFRTDHETMSKILFNKELNTESSSINFLII